MVDRAVMEGLLFRNIVQIRFGLFHGTDTADEIGKALIRIILLESIILALKRHLVGLTANKNQVIIIHGDIFNDLFVELLQKFLIL